MLIALRLEEQMNEGNKVLKLLEMRRLLDSVDEEERKRAMDAAKGKGKKLVKNQLQRERRIFLVKQQEETKLEEDAEKDELKGFLDIVPREKALIEVESLSTKFPIVDWKTCVLTETFMYYQVFRGDGSSKNYKVLSEMLEDFDEWDARRNCSD
ncbi:hypothetical protein Tco_1067523 [Tanacetum coccineum]|uniref:Uncharacterized protein n=1 Tax=Tanacetum coccineum TaxID=301880 RepID=A0ABQ5HD44_9ASTR